MNDPEFVPFNLNNRVRFTMTPEMKVHLDWSARHGVGVSLKSDVGVCVWQAWEFMAVFGGLTGFCYNDSPMPTKIELEFPRETMATKQH